MVNRYSLLDLEKEKAITENEIEKTEAREDSNTVVKRLIGEFHKINQQICICIDSTGPSLFVNTFTANEFLILKNRGVKIRFITEITKENINYCKELLNTTELRHLDNVKGNFGIVDSRYYWCTLNIKEEKDLEILHNNSKTFIKQQQVLFQVLWNKSNLAEQKIKNIEEDSDPNTEIIRRSDITFDIYLDRIQSASEEIFFIFPTPNAFIRQLKAIFVAKHISKDKRVKVRILTPINETVEEWIKKLADEEKKLRYNKRDNISSFSHAKIKVRYIEKMSNTKATIVIIDRKEYLVMELKDDTKNTFIEATGPCTHSNSKASVLSFVAIFENLWKQSELYQEIKESNEKLKTNDKMQKEFINTAAHELRTPLQPIISYLQLLEYKIKDKEQKEILDIVIKNTDRLKNLTEDILDVTKIEGNSLHLNKEKLDIVELLQSIIKEFEHNLGNSSLKFELHSKNIDSKTVIVFVDRKRISQVISNLISNSVKFISNKKGKEDQDGLISISIEKIKTNSNKIDKTNNNNNEDNKIIVIDIKDNGKGIDKEIFPRLFKKFATKSFQGTGLGLYISKKILEAHGGKIWAENNKDGKGATFSFSLPVDNQ